MYKPVKPLYAYKGKVYSWDLGSSTNAVLNYNEGYFSSHSLRVPTTFAQLLTLCKKISAFGQTPISWGGARRRSTSTTSSASRATRSSPSTPNWLKLRGANKTTFAKSAGWKQALQQILQMQSAKCFDAGVAGLQLPQMLSEFGSGQAAMMFTYGGLDALVSAGNPSLKIGQFNPPGMTAKQSALTLSPAGGLGIWAKSPNAAEAEAFIKFLAQPDPERGVRDAERPHLAARRDRPATFLRHTPGVASYFKAHKTVPTAAWEWPNTAMENSPAAGDGPVHRSVNADPDLQQFDTDWTSGG